jgi:N-acetylmuramoyl-L-alanine amidase
VRSRWLLLGACSALLFASPIHAAPIHPPSAPIEVAAEDQQPTQLEEIRITRDGFFLRTQGKEPEIDQDLSRDSLKLTLELDDTSISEAITAREFTVDRYGVTRIQLAQDGDKVILTLEFADDSLRWQASASSRGVVLVPRGGLAAAPPESRVSQSLTEVVRPRPELPTRPDRPDLPRPNRPEPAPLPDVSDRQVTIVIDPGHGGRDPGAVGIGNIHEADIVLAISNQVTTLLQSKGAEVIQTRTDDREIELEPRVNQANRARADLFISIHANAISLDRPDVNGIETYYYADQSLELARTIHASMLDGTGRANRRVRQARFYVLRNTAMPAVLLEVGFVTGAEDAPLLPDPDFQAQMAESIARGILEYVQNRL